MSGRGPYFHAEAALGSQSINVAIATLIQKLY